MIEISSIFDWDVDLQELCGVGCQVFYKKRFYTRTPIGSIRISWLAIVI